MTLAAWLEKIESSGLIRLAQAGPELEYIFRHALVQDATYESLLKVDRRNLHAAVGETMENLYPDRLDDIAPTLALHFERAEIHDKAIRYLIRAGEAATRIYAVDQAIEFFRHALELIPPFYPQNDLIHFYTQYGHVLELAGRFEAAIALYEQMRSEGVRHQNPQMELLALMARGIIHSTPSPLQDTDLAQALSARALTLAKQLGDREAESRTYWMWMLALLFDGQIDQAIVYGEQALKIAYQLNNPERLAFTLNDLAHCYSAAGQRKKASGLILEAQALWEKLENTHMLVDNLNSYAENLFMAGKLEEAHQVVMRAYTTACSIQNAWGQVFSLMLIALICAELGDVAGVLQAEQSLYALDPAQSYGLSQVALRSTCADLYLDLGLTQRAFQVVFETYQIPVGLKPAYQPPILAAMARVEVRLGNLPNAKKLLEQALQNYNPENFLTISPFYVVFAQYEIYTLQGDHLKALDSLDAYIEALKRKGILSSLPEHLLRRARTLVVLNREEEALQVLKETATAWAPFQFHRTLWKVYGLMSQLQYQLGQPAEAQQSHQQAKVSFDFLIQHTPAHLREAVLALPDAKILLQDH